MSVSWASPYATARLAASLLLAGFLAACATPQPVTGTGAQTAGLDEDDGDPLEGFNRLVFALNQTLDTFILRPLAVTYREWTPGVVQTGVRNVLDNLDQPIIAANALLQGDGERAGQSMARFMGNTIIGVGGVFDVMTDVPKVSEDFGQTLAVWGVADGPYLMLPLVGPSNVRDAAGLAVDSIADPFNWYARTQDIEWFSPTRTAANVIDRRSRLLGTLDDIERQSLDFYAALRSLYRQRRAAEIRNTPTGPVPRLTSHDDSLSTRPQTAVR